MRYSVNSHRVDTNDNGETILIWCLQNQMKIINSILRWKRIDRVTWVHTAPGKLKTMDYMTTIPWVCRYVTQCRVYYGPSPLFYTDNRLLVMNISFPSRRKILRQQISRIKPQNPKSRTVYSGLRDKKDIQQQLTEELDKEFEGFIGKSSEWDHNINCKEKYRKHMSYCCID